MSLRQKYRQIFSGAIPAGAVGLSLLLGSALSSSAREHPACLQPLATTTVSERLAAIREAVSDASGEETIAKPSYGELRLAWGNWWRNWGWGPRRWGWPNWNNWRNRPNWGNWWRNW